MAHLSSNLLPAALQHTEMPDVAASTEDYARRFSGNVGRYFLERQSQIVLSLVAPWARASILDIGGGHAQLAPPLVREGFEVTVLGSHPCCSRRLAEVLPAANHRFICGDMLNLPFESGSFDIVIAFRLLAHLHSWRTFLKEACRVARHAVIVDYPDWRSCNILSAPLFRAKRALECTTRPFRCFWRDDLVTALTENGYGFPTLCPQFSFPMALHRLLHCGPLSRGLEALAERSGITNIFGSPVVLRAARLAPRR